MIFNTDKQTLDDLNIFGKSGIDSVYTLYNNTHTRGGADILETMFFYPLSEVKQINHRSEMLRFFEITKFKFPFETGQLDSAEIYLGMTDDRTRLAANDNSFGQKVSLFLSADGDYNLIYNGIQSIIGILQSLDRFVSKIKSLGMPDSNELAIDAALSIITDPGLSLLLAEKHGRKLPYATVVEYDNLLRFRIRVKIMEILKLVYHLDVFISVAEVASKHKFTFPTARPIQEHTVVLKGVYHPLVKNAIANNLTITPDNNIVFLTGANMAGKSTFMKSLGIAIYLAHMGFPVAAAQMEFSVRDGIFTTINLPDDLNSGNSHFYAEVLRVKKIAKALSAAKNLFVIFDELFRGTNVKDAYEGTIAITKAFAEKRSCMFVVSTHIIEAGTVLKESCNNINCVYLPTKMNNNTPIYTYKLESGITGDRQGMIIINNEGILGILRSRKEKFKA